MISLANSIVYTIGFIVFIYDSMIGVNCCSNAQLLSPNYPNTYPKNSEETWLLTAPTGSKINLQFHSFQVSKINFRI